MAITFVESSATISTAERSLPADTTVGVPTAQTDDCILQVWVDWNALAAGDEYRLRIYEKVQSAGTQRVAYEISRFGAQANPADPMPTLVLGNGWDVTLLKVAGTDRAIPWSLRKVT